MTVDEVGVRVPPVDFDASNTGRRLIVAWAPGNAPDRRGRCLGSWR